MCGVGVGASKICPFTRPRSQFHVKSPASAPVGTIAAAVSHVPTSALSPGEVAQTCSYLSERDHRIQGTRAARWHVAREQRRRQERHANRQQHRHVHGAGSKSVLCIARPSA